MSLEQLANFGEFIGGLVVVISVFYVALQVRQGSNHLEQAVTSLRLTTSQYLNEDFNQYRSFLLNSDVADLWVRGLADLDSLTTPERVQFNMVASSYVWTAWYFREVNRKEGLIDDLNSRMHIDMFKHPGFRQWYSGYAETIEGDYGDYLSKLNEKALEDTDYQPHNVSNLLQGSIR